MNRKQKDIVDNIIKSVFSIIFSPIIILYGITYGINAGVKYLFEIALNPLCHKVCKIVRGPIPNSAVYIWNEQPESWKSGWHRVNDKLLTIKEAKALGKECEDKGHKVKLSLSEF